MHIISSCERLWHQLRLTQANLCYSTKVKLIQEVCTRWSMLNSICINRDALNTLALQSDHACIKRYMLNDQEFILIDDKGNFLKPFKNLTEILSGRHCVTVSILYPLYNLVQKELKNFICTKTQLISLKDFVLLVSKKKIC